MRSYYDIMKDKVPSIDLPPEQEEELPPIQSVAAFMGPMARHWDEYLAKLAKRSFKNNPGNTDLRRNYNTVQLPHGILAQVLSTKGAAVDADTLAKAIRGKSAKGKMGDFVDLPAQYKNYPEIKNWDFEHHILEKGDTKKGSIILSETPKVQIWTPAEEFHKGKASLPTIGHEVDHGIANIEGWPSGSSPEIMERKIENWRDLSYKAIQSGENPQGLKALEQELGVRGLNARRAYREDPGELSARASERWMNVPSTIQDLMNPFKGMSGDVASFAAPDLKTRLWRRRLTQELE